MAKEREKKAKNFIDSDSAVKTFFYCEMCIVLVAKCPVLDQLKNGIITLVTLRNGGEVEIKCLTNYTLDGSSKIFCRNGKWSDSLPICGGLWFYFYDNWLPRYSYVNF